MHYGIQIGVITHGNGLNLRHWIAEARKQGYVCVIDNGFTRLHLKK